MNRKHMGRRALRMFSIGAAAASLWGVAAGCQPPEPAVGELWQRQVGTAEDDALYSVARAGTSVYAAGTTQGRLPDAPAGSAKGDGYIIRLDTQGSVQWQKQLGTAGTDEWRGVAADPSGGAYVVGFTEGTFPGQTRSGGDSDAVIARIKADGSLDWVRQLGSPGADFLVAVAVDGSGAAYAVGSTYGVLPGQTLRGGSDAFVVKYRSDGTQESLTTLGSAKDDALTSIVSDGQGAFYLGGWSTDSVAAGQAALGGRDATVYRFVPGTGVAWAVQLGGTLDDEVQALAVGSGGSLYVGGRAAGGVAGQTALGRIDGFVARLDGASGSLRWARQLGTLFEDEIFGLLPHAQGGVTATGYVGLALPGGGYQGGKDVAFFRLSADGASEWATQLGTAGEDIARGLVEADGGGAIAVGTTNAAIAGQLALGKTDAFVGSYRLK
jgi:hypothetical protein